MLLEVRMDDRPRTLVDSWVTLTQPQDQPTRTPLARELGRSLAALAVELDPGSRVDASRWILKARRATLACASNPALSTRYATG